MEIIQEKFEEVFKGFDCTLDPNENYLKKMTEGQRSQYHIQAKELEFNPVWQTEFGEWKRKLYTELALRANTDLERQGYRLALIGISEFEKRIKMLAQVPATKNLTPLVDKF